MNAIRELASLLAALPLAASPFAALPLAASPFAALPFAALPFAALPFAEARAAASGPHDLVIQAGILLDGVSDAPRRQVSIVVHDDKIESVQAGWVAPPGAEIVDLRASTVMPGFIDCHVHISSLLPRDHTLEFALLIDYGLAPLQALYAATRNASELIGVQAQIGSVEPGRYADLVATAKNPTEDPGQFRHVVFVMKGGIVYRKDDVPTPAGAE